MLSILDLPVELLCHVTEYLDDGDLSTWCRAGSRLIFEIATPILYSRVKNEPGVFCWACDEGRIGTVERLLAVGANPDIEWVDDERRSRTLTRLCLKDFYAQKNLSRSLSEMQKATPTSPTKTQIAAVATKTATVMQKKTGGIYTPGRRFTLQLIGVTTTSQICCWTMVQASTTLPEDSASVALPMTGPDSGRDA